MKLIFIHGRGQQGLDASVLQEAWESALRAGFAKSDILWPKNIEVGFPFYANVLDDLVGKQSLTIEDVINKGPQSSSERVFFYDFLTELSQNVQISDQEIQENMEGRYIEKGPLNWGWIQAILKALDKRTFFGDASLKRFTLDVFLYLTIDGVRKTINEIVAKAITKEPCVIVGHSLGSIIGYDVLRLHQAPKKNYYFTLGSPLGLNSVSSKLESPLIRPASLLSWYNAFDDRDVVALNPLDDSTFRIVPPIFNNNRMRNHTDNRHGIVGYLDDREVSARIYEALVNASS